MSTMIVETKITHKYLMNKLKSDLVNMIFELLDRVEEIEKFESFHPRAVKLLRKKKNFVVIATDEPYYMQTYSWIRREEQRKGTWSDQDELCYRRAADEHRKESERDMAKARCDNIEHEILISFGSRFCDQCGKPLQS